MAGVDRRCASEHFGGDVVTMQENDVPGESRAHIWRLVLVGVVTFVVTVGVVALVDMAIGGVHQ